MSTCGGRLAGLALAAVICVTASAAAGEGAGVPIDPAARLLDGPEDAEHWDLSVRLDSGHFLFARLQITNIGPGRRTALSIGHLVSPDGGVHEFRDAHREGDWTLAPDRREFAIDASHYTLRPPRYRLVAKERDVSVDLSFDPIPHRAGATPEGATPPGLGYEVVAFDGAASGTVWEPSLDEPMAVTGRASLIHSWSRGAEWDTTLRRIEFFSLGGGTRLHLVAFTTPAGVRTEWLSVSAGAEVLLSTTDFDVDLRGETPLVWKPDYWAPARVLPPGERLQRRDRAPSPRARARPSGGHPAAAAVPRGAPDEAPPGVGGGSLSGYASAPAGKRLPPNTDSRRRLKAQGLRW